MSKLILHVGTHKTGTTSTQDTLALNRALLQRHGLIYPKIGPSNGHHSLVTDWIDLPKHYHHDMSATESWKRLAKEHGPSDRTVLISTEELSRGNPNMRVDMAQLRELCSAFNEVKIICFLRNQAAFIQSIYLQVVKGGYNIPWQAFINKALNERTATGLYLDYTELRQFFETGFARDEVHFFSYETACKEEHGVIDRVLAESGHSDLAEMLQPLPAGKSNVSPDPLMTWVAARILEGKTLEPWLIEAGRQALAESLGRRTRTTVFTNKEHQSLIETFQDRNHEFEKSELAIGRSIAIGQFFNSNETVFRNQLSQDFWIRLSRKLHDKAIAA